MTENEVKKIIKIIFEDEKEIDAKSIAKLFYYISKIDELSAMDIYQNSDKKDSQIN